MNFLYLLLLCVAMALIQCLIGGTRLLFSFPSYLLLGGAASLTILSLRRRIAKPSGFALLSTVLLGGYVLLRGWKSPYPYLAHPDLFMAAACLVVYLLTALHLTGSRERLRVVAVLLIIAGVEVSVGLFQFTQRSYFMPLGFFPPGALEGGATRANGMFISPNHFAGYLEAVAMFALAAAGWSRWAAGERGTAAFMGLLCYVGVAISLSRGGFLSSAFSLVVFTVLCLWALSLARPGKARIPAIAITVAVAALFVAALLAGAQNERIRERARRVITHDDMRFANWAATLDQFRLAPWWGTGAGTHLIYGRFFRRPRLQTDPVHSHGDYLEMLAEYGIVGEAFAALFLAAHLASGLGATRRIAAGRAVTDPNAPLAPPEPPWSNALALNLGALGAVAALLAHSVVDFNMHIPGNALLYAFAFGILANPGGRPPPVLKPARLSSLTLGRCALVVLGACLIAAILPLLKGEWYTEKARVALRDRKFNDAIRLSKAAILANHPGPEPWFYLGEANRVRATTMPVAMLKSDLYTQAVDAYRNGLRLLPQDINLLVRLGQALDGLERHKEAEAAYREAIHWDPRLAVLRAYYANHLLLTGDEESAQENFRLAQKLGVSFSKGSGAQEVQTMLRDARSGKKEQKDVGLLPEAPSQP